MNEDLEFLKKHRRGGALFDSNLLLAYVVGKTGRNRLSKLQHTKQYEDDFPIIERLVEFFQVIYTTPNVLTEVSNLGKKLGVDFFDTLNKVVRSLEERYCVSKDVVGSERFRTLGLTDCGLLMVATNILIVTADFELHNVLRKKKIDAVNFNHVRPLWWKGLDPLSNS